MRVEELVNRKLGRYEVKRMVGRGGMAVVFEAYDTMLRRAVALKVLYPQLMVDETLVERFREEAVTAARLDHPNIVPIYDVGEHDGFVYLAMKMLPGRSLQDMLAIDSTLSMEETIAFTREIAGALDYAHNRKVIHRDIKPGNIMIDSDGHAVLSDFGIAKSLDTPGMTTTGVLVGTPDYMAPEQIKSSLGPLDGRADIYALGVLVYRVLTGKRPFEGSTMQMLYGHIHEAPPPPSEVNHQLLPAVDAVLQRALAKHPDDRYQTATAFAKALEDAAGSATTAGHVAPSPAISRRARQAQANPAPAGAGIQQAADAARQARQSSPASRQTVDLPEVVERKTLPLPARRRLPIMPIGILLLVLVSVALLAAVTQYNKGRGGDGGTSVAGNRDTPVPGDGGTLIAGGAPTTTPSVTARATTARPSSTANIGTTGNLTTSTPSVEPSATEALPPTNTSRPQPVIPSRTRTRTAPPRPVATDTPEPSITPTEEPSPIPPSLTPCPVAMAGGFKILWENNPGVRASMGCPLRAEAGSNAAIQYFPNGVMIWLDYIDTIYAFVPNATSGSHSRLFNPENYKEEPTGVSCPAGQYPVERGFGRVLNGDEDLRNLLGLCALHQEAATSAAHQYFQAGEMIYIQSGGNANEGRIWVRNRDGRWTRHSDPNE